MNNSVSMIAACALLAAPAVVDAQTVYSAASDIAGFNLKMTKQEARAEAQKQAPKQPFAIDTTLTTDLIKQHVEIGFGLDKRAAGVAERLPDGTGIDIIRVLFDPNSDSNRVIGITRHVKYGFHSTLTNQAMSDALIAKYGKPDMTYLWHDGDSGFEYLWTDSKGTFDKNKCVRESYGLNGNYIYEINKGDELGDHNQIADYYSNLFVSFINGLKNQFSVVPLRNLHGCGVVMVASVSSHDGYVDNLHHKIIDTGAAVDGSFRFYNDFFHHDQNSRGQKYQSDTNNKPNL